ncbi:AzlD domain-containing protein [Rahnella selenatireducens]|uniref:AzlD domain-containing protein n=1 Tax=Rahnella selenatireducens TaxID=3389797 RepID=UPI003968DA3F
MSWLLLLSLAGIVFFNRYVFLEPRLPVRLPLFIHQALKYAAPCLLTAICGPIIVAQDGVLRVFPDNPYFWGTVFSVLFALFIRSTVTVVMLSMVMFYLVGSVL